MDLNGMVTYVAALSVSTERVTEFIKRLPIFSTFLSTEKTGTQEDVRILCVQVLAVVMLRVPGARGLVKAPRPDERVLAKSVCHGFAHDR